MRVFREKRPWPQQETTTAKTTTTNTTTKTKLLMTSEKFRTPLTSLYLGKVLLSVKYTTLAAYTWFRSS